MACTRLRRAAALLVSLASLPSSSCAAEAPGQPSRDHLLLQVTHGGGFRLEPTVLTDAGGNASASGSSSCCAACGSSSFCSPRSGSCYGGQYKSYYIACSSGEPACCCGCSGSSFCSPQSSNCYDGRYKDYYVGCPSVDVVDDVEGEDGGPACCAGCSGRSFCSPQSNNCYDGKYKDYYVGCPSADPVDDVEGDDGGSDVSPACCRGCSGRNFCSPQSNNCYDGKYKDYYVGCASADPVGGVEGDHGDHLGSGGNTSQDEPAESFTCCNSCPGRSFCSPLSTSCYNDQSKPYYMACKEANPLGFNLKTCRGSGGMRVKMLTYNLFWWNLFGQRRGNGGSAGRLVREASAGDLFDVVGFQECDDPGWIMGDAGMHRGEYDYVRWGSNTIAFRKTRWQMLTHGRDYTSEDRQDQYYGRRGLQWIRLRDTTTGGTLFFGHTHGPLPVNTGGKFGGEATGWAILGIIYRRAEKGDSIVLTGDFNAERYSSTIQLVESRIQHVMTDWVDHIFTNCGAGVAQTRNLGKGGSDHDALMAVINF